MAAGACMGAKNHRTRLATYAVRGPGNIEGLGRTGKKYAARSKRMAKRKGAKA